MNTIELQEILKNAFIEDIGTGDLTSGIIFSDGRSSRGVFKAKAFGVISGLGIIEAAYHMLDPNIEVVLNKKDGERVQAGDSIAIVEGPTAHLLTGERIILNLIQHMSGVSTSTYQAIGALDDDSIRVCDTRKTLPGLRMLQKYAVTCGGGYNHRFRLDDGVMIKDNHIKAAGSISSAVRIVRESIGHMVKIEVETETKEQVLEAVEAGADVIMLDNRSPEQVKEWAALIPDHIITEVSGGITPDTIGGYKGTGVDYISLGWLTHSVKALDISFNLDHQ